MFTNFCFPYPAVSASTPSSPPDPTHKLLSATGRSSSLPQRSRQSVQRRSRCGDVTKGEKQSWSRREGWRQERRQEVQGDTEKQLGKLKEGDQEQVTAVLLCILDPDVSPCLHEGNGSIRRTSADISPQLSDHRRINLSIIDKLLLTSLPFLIALPVRRRHQRGSSETSTSVDVCSVLSAGNASSHEHVRGSRTRLLTGISQSSSDCCELQRAGLLR
eukprot:753130-Hanusia_phi.AAC.1